MIKGNVIIPLKMIIIGLYVTIGLSNCGTSEQSDESKVMAFDAQKWKALENGQYLYRSQMTDAILYSDTIRNQDETEILELLGEPDRRVLNHLYYIVSRSKLGAWTLSQQTIVIKLDESNSVEWIKLHGG